MELQDFLHAHIGRLWLRAMELDYELQKVRAQLPPPGSPPTLTVIDGDKKE